MPYNSVISRADAGALIPEEAAREILATLPEGSTVMKLATRLPNMARGQLRMPVLSALPIAYFVGETGRSPQTFDAIKQTSEANWENKYINAEEMACIIPIPQSVIDDADYDIWTEIRPHIVSAFGKLFDNAVFNLESDTGAPANWPDGILLGMPAAHQIALGDVGDLYDDILGEGGVIAKVEEDGFFVNGHVGAIGLRSKLRGLREKVWNGSSLVAQGSPVFTRSMQDPQVWELDGAPINFPLNGAVDAAQFLLLSGDWKKLVYSIRTDVSYKLLTEGVITDNASPRAIIYNLGQDDMVALRVTFRLGWQLPNPINAINSDAATRYPFAALVPAGSGS